MLAAHLNRYCHDSCVLNMWAVPAHVWDTYMKFWGTNKSKIYMLATCRQCLWIKTVSFSSRMVQNELLPHQASKGLFLLSLFWRGGGFVDAVSESLSQGTQTSMSALTLSQKFTRSDRICFRINYSQNYESECTKKNTRVDLCFTCGCGNYDPHVSMNAK